MMRPTPLLRWTYLDCIGLPLDGWPAAKVNRNSQPYYYILEQLWRDDDGLAEDWRPVPFAKQGDSPCHGV